MPLRHDNFHRRVWLPALAKTDLTGVHFHDLRHAGNTYTANAGANLRELMARMGHSTSRAALIYQHSTDQRQRVLADAVDKTARAELRQARKKPAKIARAARHSRASDGCGTESETCLMKIICLGRKMRSDLAILRGAPSATRTRDLLLRRQLLYPLSYRG
jgi:Phage integrase family